LESADRQAVLEATRKETEAAPWAERPRRAAETVRASPTGSAGRQAILFPKFPKNTDESAARRRLEKALVGRSVSEKLHYRKYCREKRPGGGHD
jgi:hypothetical protein